MLMLVMQMATVAICAITPRRHSGAMRLLVRNAAITHAQVRWVQMRAADADQNW